MILMGMSPADFGLDDPWMMRGLFLVVFMLAFGIVFGSGR